MPTVNARAPFNDADGDGLDDISGLPRREHEAGGGDGSVSVSAAGSLEAMIVDRNNDGRDDETGQTQDELNRALEGFGFNRYSDADGDGLDDRTRLDRESFRQQENLIRGRAADSGGPATRSYDDSDGDGKDDATGLDEGAFETLQGRVRSTYSPAARDSAERERTADRATSERQRASAAEEQRASDAAAYEQEYREYVESGQRTADLRAGRPSRPAPGTPGAPGYAPPGAPSGAGGGGGNDGALNVPKTGIGIVDYLSGASAEDAAVQAEIDRLRNEERVQRLRNYIYTPEDVAIEYGQLGLIEEAPVTQAEADQGSIEAERRALAQFEDIYGSGGLTAADRGRLQQGEREMARAMRSQREADMAALRARGLGGSGASIASMLSAQQSGADMLADREAEIARRAEDRAMQALSGASETAGRMRGQSFDESSWNAGAMNDWNQRSADYYREREKYNVGAQDKTKESAADSLREQLEVQERMAGHEADVWEQGQGAQERAEARKEDAYQRQTEGLAGALDKILRG